MDSNAKTELESIKRELRSIINELNDISAGIKRDFQGIDSHLCSMCIDKVTNDCSTALRRLNNLDTNTLTKAFEKMMEKK